jgi:hypothetical protein
MANILLQVCIFLLLQGLRILGFPCNQFGGQEPGTDEEIKVDRDENNCLKSVLRSGMRCLLIPGSGMEKIQIGDLGEHPRSYFWELVISFLG